MFVHRGPVSNRFLQSVLSQYLSFNSDIHLLSVTTLKILLALYSVSNLDYCFITFRQITKVACGCSNFSLTGMDMPIFCQYGIVVSVCIGSDDVIVNGVLRVSSVAALFTNHNSLLIWAYFQVPLKQQSITKEWVIVLNMT